MGERRTRRILEASDLKHFPSGTQEKGARGSRAKWFTGGVVCLVAAMWIWTRGIGPVENESTVGTVFGGGFFLVIALLSFGLTARSPKPSSFRLINATVMTRAERPTADSWVHLAQTSTNGVTLIMGVGIAGVGCLGISVYAGLQAFGVIAQVNTDVSEAGPFLGMLFMGALGFFLCWITLLMAQRKVRSGGIGARPSGVALGETSVAVRVPGRDVEIPWMQIESVDIVATMPAANDRAVPPMIRITLREGPVAGRAQMLAGEGYRVPSSALYTALRWYLEHADARWELGRVEGERRLEAWCAAGRAGANSR